MGQIKNEAQLETYGNAEARLFSFFLYYLMDTPHLGHATMASFPLLRASHSPSWTPEGVTFEVRLGHVVAFRLFLLLLASGIRVEV
jgi:hypothetical protein